MTPTPQEHSATQQDVTPVANDDTIVISGMAGLYPQSRSIKELSDILYNKINPISDKMRWKIKHPEMAKFAGNISELNRFDSQMFKVNFRQGQAMDPMSRKILEQTYCAIYDAGVNPEQLAGKRIGVFIGFCSSESERYGFESVHYFKNGLSITGCARAMFANRISYWLNVKGPSVAIDEECCSSAAALEQAYMAMRSGDCEGAIVGGCHLSIHPQTFVHYGRLMKNSKDGKTKSFDQNADGSVKSEAINVLFLQKAMDAMRIYAELMHAKTEYIGILQDETATKYCFLRDHVQTVNFLNKFYEEAKVSPQTVEYVEALGCAKPEADKAELEVIDEVFCENRDNPVLVGSVTSNIGYTEAASGISGITKVLLGYHTGVLAANLHCENPRKDVEALRKSRVKIVTEHENFGRTYAAVNGMSITGINSHILLRGRYKPKDLSRYQSSISHLVTLSARQETFVQNMIAGLKSRPIDYEELALLRNIHQFEISGHLGRGYVILDTNEEQKSISLAENTEHFDNEKKPLWFVYSGMGSQWAGMGAQLMRIPIFAAAIDRCRLALEPKGIDIVHILTYNDDKIYDDIMHTFLGIAAIQIGLTDVLRKLGLVPDKIIGHSVGELGCAYADGCMTAEEMILSAYSRGLVSLQTPFIKGSMSAVGLGFDKLSKIIPPGIEIACHNGPESSTISGPAGIMRKFVMQLTAKGIFAKEVPCSSIAYHSSYVSEAGLSLLKCLKEVLKTPKLRSKRWISTSVPKDKWDEDLGLYSSAEYHTNNFLGPVLFEEILAEVPDNAVLVEIAPHGLLQAILKRSLPAECTNIALTGRKHHDNTIVLLEAIGKLYIEGYDPKVHMLYPKVEMPVSTGTPFLSHHEWYHGDNWTVPWYDTADRIIASTRTCLVSLHDTESKYLQGSVIRGVTVYPFAAVLVAVWDTLAMSIKVPKKELTVEFRDIHLYAQPILQQPNILRLSIEIHKGSGYFQVLDGRIKVAMGYIIHDDHIILKDKTKSEEPNYGTEDMTLTAPDIYSLLQEQDHFYSGDFQSIIKANIYLTEVELVWQNNWVTFIDGILQINMLRSPHRISKLAHIKRIFIDIEKHNKILNGAAAQNVLLKAMIYENYNYSTCGGILIEGIRHEIMPVIPNNIMELQALQIVQNGQTNLDVATCIHVFLQIIAENINKSVINILGIANYSKKESAFDVIQKTKLNIGSANIQYTKINQEFTVKNNNCDVFSEADVVIVNNLSGDDCVCQQLYKMLRPDTFIINEENQMIETQLRPMSLYRVLLTLSGKDTNSSLLQLIRWRPTPATPIATSIAIYSPTDYILLTSARNKLPPNHRIVIFSPYPAPTGLKELVKTWRKEADRNLIQLIMVNNERNGMLTDQLPDIDLNNIIVDQVHYAGINSNDVKKANGTISFEKNEENCFGMDFSGTTESGDRVMGIVLNGAMRSQVTAKPELLWPVPAHWTLEEAATVPLAYMFALYCLVIKGNLTRGQRVLITGGCGAVGQAAIAVALYLDCEVFTTVSDTHKKQFLRKLFPQIKENHIGYSRDSTFVDMVYNETKGRGCDVVVSNMKGDLRDAAFTCAGYISNVVDISQLYDNQSYTYGMEHLNRCHSCWILDLAAIFQKENKEELMLLQSQLSDGIAAGFIRPLSHVTYAPQDTARALRLQASSRHRGRVLIRVEDDALDVQKRFSCISECCQLIIFDEDKFGPHLADTLIYHGANKLYINYKSYSKSKLQFKIRSWQKNGVQVQVAADNLNTDTNIVDLLTAASKLGSIQGIYTIVGAEEVVHESFFSALDSASRTLCPKLMYFVVLNMGESMSGQSTCFSRAGSMLPATMLSIPEYGNTSTNLTWRDALSVMERALLMSETVLTARTIPREKNTLLEEIAKRAGLLEKPVKPLNEVKGLEVLISQVNSDVMQATAEIMLLPTLTTEENLVDIEFDGSQTHMCVVPGIEGDYTRFMELCARLKVPALVLQPGLDHPNETTRGDQKILLSKTGLKEKFYILGYESGVLVALEIANILEKHGLTGTIYCLGYAPDELQVVIEELLSEYKTPEQLQDAVVRHMFKLMRGEDTAGLDKALQNSTSWPQKVNVCVQILKGYVSYSLQYASGLIGSALDRIEQVRQYNVKARRLRSRLVLLRPATSCGGADMTSLQQYSQQPVVVHQLGVPLAHATKDMCCASVINEYLDDKILKEFEKNSLCNKYSLDFMSFMSGKGKNKIHYPRSD